VRFAADGVVPLIPQSFVLAPAPVDFSQLPPWLAGGLVNGTIVARQRMTFTGEGREKDILSVQVYCIAVNRQIPLSQALPVITIFEAKPGDVVTISLFLTKIDRLEVSNNPSPNFALAGIVTKMIVPSPFGDLVGRSAVFTAGLTAYANGTADYQMLGGAVAGSHTSYSPSAEGIFKFQKSFSNDDTD